MHQYLECAMLSQNSILCFQSLSYFYDKPYPAFYQFLKNYKKDVYLDNERLVFYDCTSGVPAFYKLFRDVLTHLDIPLFFVKVITNNTSVVGYLNNNNAELISTTVIESIEPSPLPTQVTNFNIPSNICITPWVNVEINNSGQLHFCCIANKTHETNRHTDVLKFYNSDYLKNIRKTFLDGNTPKECASCMMQESEGKVSKRIRDRHVYKDMLFDTDYNNFASAELVSLDIKLGYTCNFACRICNSDSSSKWYDEIQKNKTLFPNANLKINKADWVNDNNSMFGRAFEDSINNLKFLTFAGGEPFLDKKHVELLKTLINTKRSSKIEIHYNTNGSIFPEHLIDIFKHFKKVEISISLDNINEKFEYDRGGSWEHIDTNIRKFINSGYEVNFFTTVSILNILDLTTIDDYATALGINVEYNPLLDPWYFSIANLPQTIKTHIKNYYISGTNQNFLGRISGILSFINQPADSYFYNDFIKNIKLVDAIRNQNFEATHNNIWELLQTDILDQND